MVRVGVGEGDGIRGGGKWVTGAGNSPRIERCVREKKARREKYRSRKGKNGKKWEREELICMRRDWKWTLGKVGQRYWRNERRRKILANRISFLHFDKSHVVYS